MSQNHLFLQKSEDFIQQEFLQHKIFTCQWIMDSELCNVYLSRCVEYRGREYLYFLVLVMNGYIYRDLVNKMHTDSVLAAIFQQIT